MIDFGSMRSGLHAMAHNFDSCSGPSIMRAQIFIPSPPSTARAIEGFPRPHIGQEARARGAVAVHMAMAVIMVLSIYILCSDYVVPALEILVERLGMNSEVAGGTLMAAFGSISPFVTSVLGINVAQTDSRLSTTMGFGILKAAGIMGIAALCAGRTVRLNAWPVRTSSLYYFVAMAIVLGALMDNKIMTATPKDKPEIDSETSGWRSVVAVILRPFSYIISWLVPDCRTPNWKEYFIVSIVMSCILIAACSYVLVWMLAVIGLTLSIQDGVLGLTFLCMFNSLPDVFSSVIVVRKGSGDMAISYLLGTNIFEVLAAVGFCKRRHYQTPASSQLQ